MFAERARLQVVDTHHPMPALEQRVTEMRTEKTGTAGDDRSRHRRQDTRRSDRQHLPYELLTSAPAGGLVSDASRPRNRAGGPEDEERRQTRVQVPRMLRACARKNEYIDRVRERAAPPSSISATGRDRSAATPTATNGSRSASRERPVHAGVRERRDEVVARPERQPRLVARELEVVAALLRQEREHDRKHGQRRRQRSRAHAAPVALLHEQDRDRRREDDVRRPDRGRVAEHDPGGDERPRRPAVGRARPRSRPRRTRSTPARCRELEPGLDLPGAVRPGPLRRAAATTRNGQNVNRAGGDASPIRG